MYDWGNKKILIAEDEEINYIFLEEALFRTNAKITWAKNGEAALNHFKAEEFDLVLLDIKMPKMNGIEVAEAMKALRFDIPIIAQTAYAMAGEKEKIMAAGFDAYISKPIRPRKLLSLIGKFLNDGAEVEENG